MQRNPMATPPISQEMIALYDEYTHVTLDRRTFMEKLTRLAGSAAAAAAIAPMIAADPASAAQVPSDDPRLRTRRFQFFNEVAAYLLGAEIQQMLSLW